MSDERLPKAFVHAAQDVEMLTRGDRIDATQNLGEARQRLEGVQKSVETRTTPESWDKNGVMTPEELSGLIYDYREAQSAVNEGEDHLSEAAERHTAASRLSAVMNELTSTPQGIVVLNEVLELYAVAAHLDSKTEAVETETQTTEPDISISESHEKPKEINWNEIFGEDEEAKDEWNEVIVSALGKVYGDEDLPIREALEHSYLLTVGEMKQTAQERNLNVREIRALIAVISASDVDSEWMDPTDHFFDKVIARFEEKDEEFCLDVIAEAREELEKKVEEKIQVSSSPEKRIVIPHPSDDRRAIDGLVKAAHEESLKEGYNEQPWPLTLTALSALIQVDEKILSSFLEKDLIRASGRQMKVKGSRNAEQTFTMRNAVEVQVVVAQFHGAGFEQIEEHLTDSANLGKHITFKSTVRKAYNKFLKQK